MIKSFGYAVITARSGEAAVELALKDAAISLVLMDITERRKAGKGPA